MYYVLCLADKQYMIYIIVQSYDESEHMVGFSSYGKLRTVSRRAKKLHLAHRAELKTPTFGSNSGWAFGAKVPDRKIKPCAAAVCTTSHQQGIALSHDVHIGV